MLSPYSVFIVDEDAPIRDALLRLLRGEGFRARAFAAAADFLNALPDDRYACVVADVRTPVMEGTALIRQLRALRGDAWPIIAITGHADVPLAVQTMKAGVTDFIEKPLDPNRILESVRVCMAALDRLSAERTQQEEVQARLLSLTPRERQVFDALIEGYSNKEIAQALDISPRTVEIFRAKVMTKMQAGSLPVLIRMGLRALGGHRSP